MDTFAEDLRDLLEFLDLQSFILVGASMGCNEALGAFERSEFISGRCKVVSSFKSVA